MYYSAIKNYDIANGPGCRVSLFVSGCTNHCKGCFQPETWDFYYGKPFTAEVALQILNMCDSPQISGLTLLGGDPMEPANQEVLVNLLRMFRYEFCHTKTVWCYTGFTLENLLRDGSYPKTVFTEEFLHMIDVLVDGPFVEKLKNPSLWFRGSSNQRILDMKATLKNGAIVELPNRDRKSRPLRGG